MYQWFKMKIVIQPIGHIDKSIVEFLTQRISSVLDTGLNPPIAIPKDAYDSDRRQFEGSLLLQALPDKGTIMLGVIDEDTYVNGLNFIFGLACGNKAIISLYRLRPEFYGSPKDEDLFKLRALKESMHELGHVFGLGHCPDRRCMMHFSNSILDTDYKDWRHCRSCAARLFSKKSFEGISQ